MNLSRFSCCATSISVAIAMLAGCGASQPPIAGPGGMQQSRTIATPAADRGGSRLPPKASPSWMRRGAERDNLLYVTTGHGVTVFTYPQGQIVGNLSGVGGAIDGECVDHHGDVFVTDQLYSRLDEFAHGRVGKITELQTHRVAPISCAIDPATGNLAAVGFSDKVNVFKHAQGAPEVSTAQKPYVLLFCSYDSHGNLFVVGENEKRYMPILLELPADGRKLIDIKLETAIAKKSELSGAQWDGKYLVVGAYKGYSNAKIHRFAIYGNRAKEITPVVLSSPADELFQFDVVGDVVVLPNVYLASNLLRGNVLIYKYPAGGKPTQILTKHIGDAPRGVVVSMKSQ